MSMKFSSCGLAIAVAMSLCVSGNAADSVSSASKTVSSTPATAQAAVNLEGQRTLAAKGGDRLPDNLDAVTSASVVPAVKRKIKMQRKRKLIVQSDPIVTLVNLSLRATATAAAVAVASR